MRSFGQGELNVLIQLECLKIFTAVYCFIIKRLAEERKNVHEYGRGI
jgi:hypothetical protein